MDERQSEAIASLCLMAAFADGTKDDRERDRIREIFESLEGVDHSTVYQRVLLKKATLASEAGVLDTPELRTLAYELAVGVCESDGRASPAEREFLAGLADALGIDAGRATRLVAAADSVAEAPLEPPLAEVLPVAARPSGAPVVETTPDKAVDDLVLRTAMLCGGLELLPQNLATLGIVPLQAKLVHDVGRHYGHELDRGHIGEFIATIGAGMTSQVVEGYARKFLGKLAKKHLGKMAGSLASVAVGGAMSFATTWAIGQVAKQYYAGGRRMAAIDLRRLYDEQLGRGRELYTRQMAERAGALPLRGFDDIVGLLRGR